MRGAETVKPDANVAFDFYRKMSPFAQAYREDAEFRSRVDADPRAVMAEHNFDMPPGVELRVEADTADTFHVVLPPDPNVALSDESLGVVAGGKTGSTIGSAGSASTLATICTTGSSASSAGSVGSLGSAG